MQILKNTEQIAHRNFAQNLLNRNSTPQNIPLSGTTSNQEPLPRFVHHGPTMIVQANLLLQCLKMGQVLMLLTPLQLTEWWSPSTSDEEVHSNHLKVTKN